MKSNSIILKFQLVHHLHLVSLLISIRINKGCCIFANHICAPNPFSSYIFTQQKGHNIALPVFHCYTHTHTRVRARNNVCMYVHTLLLHCDIRGMPITSIVTSLCNHVAKTNAFARISLRLLPTLFFPSQFLEPRSSRLSVFRVLFLFLASVYIQWRMKAF